jgi:hypothetical protein
MRWSPDHSALAVLTHAEELIAVCDVSPLWSPREAALRALDEALSSARLSRSVDGELTLVRIALYNPCTYQVAVGSLPHTAVFSDRSRIDCPPSGVLATVGEDTVVLPRGRFLPTVELGSFAQLTRVVEAHS